MRHTDYVRQFEALGLSDVASVGGKTASLGELSRLLAAGDVAVPQGFAITAEAYRDALAEANAWTPLRALFEGLDVSDVEALSEAAARARDIVYRATGGASLRAQILDAYHHLQGQVGGPVDVAVRSSATAEDLPNASFAGQH